MRCQILIVLLCLLLVALTTAQVCQSDLQLNCTINRGDIPQVQLCNSNSRYWNITVINRNRMCQLSHFREQGMTTLNCVGVRCLNTTDCRRTHTQDECEQWLRIFLSGFCTSDTVTSNHPVSHPMTSSSSPQQETKTTVPMKTTSNVSLANGKGELDIQQPTTGNCTLSLTALGVLVGLLVALLMMVTTGWIWTCWILRRREGLKVHSQSKESGSDR